MEKAQEKEAVESQQTLASGPFEFFRKYQKVILYTAGLFALVSFSITGALMGLFDYLFRVEINYGTLEVQGRVVQVTDEDYAVGRRVHQTGGGLPAIVLPPIGLIEDETHVEILALLRRVAIEMGMEVSGAEVDRAIDQFVQQQSALATPVTPTQIALQFGHGSLQAYRNIVAEGMRIGNYLRLEALAADTTDAAMASDLLDQRKNITLKVAQFDKKAVAEALEAEDPSDEVVQTWIEELEEAAKFVYLDTNHVTIQLAAAIYESFDPEQFTEELTDVEFGDERLRLIYDRDRETRFRKDEDKETPAPRSPDQGSPDQANPAEQQNQTPPNPPDTANPPDGQDPPVNAQTPGQDPQQGPPPEQGPYKTFEEVRAEILKMAQAEEVLQGFWREIQIQRTEHLSGPQEARDTALTDRAVATQADTAAELALSAQPASAELKEQREAAAAELEARETALEEAETALEAARASFDMKAAFEGLANGRPGLSIVDVPGPVNADGLNDLPELGNWSDSFVAVSMTSAGDLSSLIQRADNGPFHFMVTEIVERPLKPFADIREDARTAYFTAKSDEQAAEKGEAFDAALLRMAKEQIPDRVAELEAERTTLLEERVTEWRDEQSADLAAAREALASIGDNTALRAYQAQLAVVTALEEELAKEEERRQEFQEALDLETEEKIASEAREIYKDVLDRAAAEAGFEVATLPSYSTRLASEPRFEYRYGENVQFLLRNQVVLALKEGEITDLLDDTTGRALYMALCTAVEDITLDDITRRDLLQSRDSGFGFGFPELRLQQTYFQSFTLDALRKRFRWEEAVLPEVAESASAPKPK